MGNKVTSSTGLSSGKSSTNESGTSNTKQTGTSEALWDPTAQGLISTLANSAGKYNDTASMGSSTLQQILSGSNPYVNEYINQANTQADTDYSNALRQTRTGGFRGGQGRDFINQASLASNYANQKGLWNAETRLNAYNQNVQNQLNAANAASGQNAQTLALLQLLRGESTKGESDSTYAKRGSTSSTSFSGAVGASS